MFIVIPTWISFSKSDFIGQLILVSLCATVDSSKSRPIATTAWMVLVHVTAWNCVTAWMVSVYVAAWMVPVLVTAWMVSVHVTACHCMNGLRASHCMNGVSECHCMNGGNACLCMNGFSSCHCMNGVQCMSLHVTACHCWVAEVTATLRRMLVVLSHC